MQGPPSVAREADLLFRTWLSQRTDRQLSTSKKQKTEIRVDLRRLAHQPVLDDSTGWSSKGLKQVLVLANNKTFCLAAEAGTLVAQLRSDLLSLGVESHFLSFRLAQLPDNVTLISSGIVPGDILRADVVGLKGGKISSAALARKSGFSPLAPAYVPQHRGGVTCRAACLECAESPSSVPNLGFVHPERRPIFDNIAFLASGLAQSRLAQQESFGFSPPDSPPDSPTFAGLGLDPLFAECHLSAVEEILRPEPFEVGDEGQSIRVRAEFEQSSSRERAESEQRASRASRARRARAEREQSASRARAKLAEREQRTSGACRARAES